MRPAFVRDSMSVRSPNYVLAFGYFAATLALAILGLAFHVQVGGIWMPLALSGIVTSALLRRLRHRTGRVRATEEGLWLNDRLAFARAKVRQGLVVHEGADTWVRLQGARYLDVRVESEEQAQELLRAMALDVGSTTATFSLMTRSPQSMVVTASALLMMGVGFSVAMVVARGGGVRLSWALPAVSVGMIALFVAAGVALGKRFRA